MYIALSRKFKGRLKCRWRSLLGLVVSCIALCFAVMRPAFSGDAIDLQNNGPNTGQVKDFQNFTYKPEPQDMDCQQATAILQAHGKSVAGLSCEQRIAAAKALEDALSQPSHHEPPVFNPSPYTYNSPPSFSPANAAPVQSPRPKQSNWSKAAQALNVIDQMNSEIESENAQRAADQRATDALNRPVRDDPVTTGQVTADLRYDTSSSTIDLRDPPTQMADRPNSTEDAGNPSSVVIHSLASAPLKPKIEDIPTFRPPLNKAGDAPSAWDMYERWSKQNDSVAQSEHLVQKIGGVPENPPKLSVDKPESVQLAENSAETVSPIGKFSQHWIGDWLHGLIMDLLNASDKKPNTSNGGKQ